MVFDAFLSMVGPDDIERYRVVPGEATVAPIDPNGLVGAIAVPYVRFCPSSAHAERENRGQQGKVGYFHRPPPIGILLLHPCAGHPMRLG